jgi:hypothetical protein
LLGLNERFNSARKTVERLAPVGGTKRAKWERKWEGRSVPSSDEVLVRSEGQREVLLQSSVEHIFFAVLEMLGLKGG